MAKSDEENETRHDKILKEARERLRKCIDEDRENRALALDDLKFIDGEQWPEKIKREREADDRPCLVINKAPTFIDQVVGDMRQNSPAIKVVPGDSKASPYVAEILSGWTRHVQQISQAPIAITHAGEHATACGYGAFRVVTEFIDDDSFEQEAYIRKIDNALAVYWGKHTEYDCSDAQYCFIITDMDRDEYKQTYGDDPMPFNQDDSQFVEGWATENTVRLAEYFVKELNPKIIYELADGSVVEALPKGEKAVKTRKVKGYKIKWYLLSGNKVKDEKEWVGKKYIPVVPVWGKELNVGGKRKIRGLIRSGKDPMRMYNYWSSCDTEIVALAPKSPYLATPKQLAGHENQWKEAHRKNYGYMLYNPDEKAPGPPQRQSPPQVSSAMVTKIQMADQEIRDTVGLQKASMGMPSNEKSGVAIRERKREGDVGTFAFIDNLTRSVEHLGRILIDIAPGLLDTERIIRLGLEGDKQKFEAINVETPDGHILNDLSIGKYNVVATVGPSYTTQRVEARQSMGEFIQYFPQAAPLIGDQYAKVMDWPGAEAMSKRLRFLVPKEIRDAEDKEQGENAGGAPVPPPPEPPPPDPLMQAKLQEADMKLKELNIKLQQEQAKLEGIQLENQIKAATSKENIKKLVDEIINENTGMGAQ
jgi:hypothetical protein